MELPEAVTLAEQLTATLPDRIVSAVVAGHSPHRFAFFQGDPGSYAGLLTGRRFSSAQALGGMVELHFETVSLLVNDGVRLRCREVGAALPEKHQLLLTFADGSALSASVQMYGALLCYPTGTLDNPYFEVALARPSPLTPVFDRDYFDALLAPAEVQKLPLKAALATQQRIPGLGNGVLQDILWTAKLHPRRKVGTLDPGEVHGLRDAIRAVLVAMAEAGGRDTETDLFGAPGGYPTVMSQRHVGEPCPVCGTARVKQAYLGGSIHVCPVCQQL